MGSLFFIRSLSWGGLFHSFLPVFPPVFLSVFLSFSIHFRLVNQLIHFRLTFFFNLEIWSFFPSSFFLLLLVFPRAAPTCVSFGNTMISPFPRERWWDVTR